MSGVYSALARIGRNAEVRQAGGTAVAGFPAAVDVGFGKNKSTLWLDCSIWGKRAESGLVQYLVKGQQVHLIGEIGTRDFNKRDGSPGFAVTLRVADINLAGGGNQAPPQGGQQGQPQQQPQQQPPPQSQPPGYGAPPPQAQPPQGGGGGFDDEIPFSRFPNIAGG